MSLFRQIINISKPKISSLNVYYKFLSTSSDDPIHTHIDKLVKSNKIVVFMKGDPQAPRCGFSNAVIDILSIHKAKFEAHDVLKDENLRNGNYEIFFLLLMLLKVQFTVPLIFQVIFRSNIN